MQLNETDASERLPSASGSEVVKKPPRKIEDIAAERQAGLTRVELDYGDAMSKDDRCTEIGDKLFDLGLTEDGGLLMPFLEADTFPEQTNECLFQYEQKKRKVDSTYDVTQQEPKRLAQILERGLQAIFIAEEQSNQLAAEAQFTKLRDRLQDLPADEKIQAMLDPNNADVVPPAERAKWATLKVLVDLTTTPRDREVVLAKIDGLDSGNDLPTSIFFVETAILADEVLTESYRDNVAIHFNLPNSRIKTGGQVDKTLDARAEDGGPLYTPDHPVVLGNSSTAYEKLDGSRAVLVSVPGRGGREIPWQSGESDDVIGTKISLAKIWAVNEWSGQTDFFGEGIDIETHVMSQTDPQKLTKVRNVMNALFGGTSGFDAIIIQDDEADFLGWFNQFTATKGEAMELDFDESAAVENRTNLGIHPNGNPQDIDYDVLRAAANFARAQFVSGEPSYRDLQKHLHKLFPDRVPVILSESSILGMDT